MPPKGSGTAPATSKSKEMTEESYYLYAGLRILMAQTGISPDWALVAEALGSKAKPHTLYCRFDTLKKKAVPGFNSEDIPDINEFIGERFPNGSVGKKGAGRPPADKTKRTAKSGVTQDTKGDSAFGETKTTKGRKRTATPSDDREKKIKLEEETDAEVGSEGQDDSELAV